jgi:hypothetical protein
LLADLNEGQPAIPSIRIQGKRLLRSSVGGGDRHIHGLERWSSARRCLAAVKTIDAAMDCAVHRSFDCADFARSHGNRAGAQ